MKFRAVIHEQLFMKEFLNTVVTLSKLSKECVMIISSHEINFIVNEESASSSPFVWIEIKTNIYFDEYTMQGVAEKYPQIFLNFNPSNLARALSALRNTASFVKFKLTNKLFPCITIEIEIPSNNSIQNRRVTHDVPVNVIPCGDWCLYGLPKIPNYKIILTMPSFRFMRNFFDKIKNLSPSITICATGVGELSFISETDSATVASHYRNLEIKKINIGNDENKKTVEASCLIDCKKTAAFLSALQFSNAELSCGIVPDHLIQLEIEIRPGVLMICFIPANCI